MTIVDPVCGREIDDVEYPEQVEYEGETYWFCSIDHAQQFQMHPERYIVQEEELEEDVLEY